MQIPVDWLLEGEAWIAYRTRRDVLNQPENDPAVQAARAAMLASPLVQKLLSELGEWPGTVLSSHKSASQPFHKLTFLAELGLKAADPGVNEIAARILEQASPEGPFRLPMNIAEHYGGTGQELWGWALCDAPLIVSALLRLGYEHEPAVQKALQYLTGLVRENGWPCVVSKELGSFRGPGRKADPCPFATLAMLKALAAADSLRDGPAARTGAETLLSLWTQSVSQHPYMFFMGTDFRKLKVPFVWYDLMHVLEVLSRFPWLRDDPRLHAMLETMSAKADAQGRFTLESVWTAWKEWEFGQKKTPSRWLTLTAWRILQRVEAAPA